MMEISINKYMDREHSGFFYTILSGGTVSNGYQAIFNFIKGDTQDSVQHYSFKKNQRLVFGFESSRPRLVSRAHWGDSDPEESPAKKTKRREQPVIILYHRLV